MKLTYHSRFQKQFKNLPPAQKKRLQKTLQVFQDNPNNPSLYNHPLTGEWKGYRSIAFGGDWRAHFRVIDNDTVLFVAVGTHAQLYK